MPIDWDEVKRKLSPIKDYDDVCQRLETSFSYPFVRQTFNFTIPELISYSQKLLVGDSRARYTDYESKLVRIFTELHRAGMKDVLDLKNRTGSHEQLELFIRQSGVPVYDVVAGFKYLIY